MSSPRTRRVHRFFDEIKHHNQNIRVARGNNVAEFVEFFKEKFTHGEYYFTKFIWYLTTPVNSLRGYHFNESDSPSSVLSNIMQEFFDLLKNTPELPQIGVPFIKIIEAFSLPTHDTFNKEDYIARCNVIVDNFISDKKLDIDDGVAKSIKMFFTNVVSILSDFIYTRNLQIIPEARIAIGVIMERIWPILEVLIHVIKINKPYHKIIQGFTIEDLIAYGKAEREKDINELKKRNSKTYRLDEYQINQGLDELAEERQEERDERRQQRKYEGKEGGRRRLKTRSIKTIKRRAYKKRSYKK